MIWGFVRFFFSLVVFFFWGLKGDPRCLFLFLNKIINLILLVLFIFYPNPLLIKGWSFFFFSFVFNFFGFLQFFFPVFFFLVYSLWVLWWCVDGFCFLWGGLVFVFCVYYVYFNFSFFVRCVVWVVFVFVFCLSLVVCIVGHVGGGVDFRGARVFFFFIMLLSFFKVWRFLRWVVDILLVYREGGGGAEGGGRGWWDKKNTFFFLVSLILSSYIFFFRFFFLFFLCLQIFYVSRCLF